MQEPAPVDGHGRLQPIVHSGDNRGQVTAPAYPGDADPPRIDVLDVGVALEGEHVGADGQLLLKNMRFVSRAFVQKLHKGKIKENDILLVKDGATIGKVALLKRMPYAECTVNEHVFILRAASNCLPGLLYQVLRSQAVQNLIWQQVTGSAQPGLNSTFTKGTTIALPPLSEQSAIVRYLDYMDRRIQRYIRAKQKLIKLLEEQKQAIIHQAVTGRIDVRTGKPYPAYKPSGVEWLGDVPEHWEVLPLCRKWTVTDCKHLTVPFVDVGIALISVGEVQSFDVRLGEAKHTTEEWFQVLVGGNRQPHRGDLVYCRNVSVGAAAVLETTDTCAMGQDVCLIRSEAQSQRFLNYFMRSPVMAQQLALLKVGSTFDRINVSEVKSLIVVVPPPDEQRSIVRSLDRSLMGTERSIGVIRSELALLREYRTRLISDVVTGKLDVREAAANLPDDLEEELPEDQEQDTEEDEDPVDEQQVEDEA